MVSIRLEPYDKDMLSQIMQSDNAYHSLILLMKLDTQTYYNIRMIIGYEVDAKNCTLQTKINHL